MEWLLHNLYIHVYSKHLNINKQIVLAFEREDQSLVKANHIMPVLHMEFFFGYYISNQQGKLKLCYYQC